MEVLIQKKNIVFDATILSTLMGCERLTDFRFNHNFVSIGGKSNSLECGSLVHKILEFYYKSLRDGKIWSDAVSEGMKAGYEYIRLGDEGTGLFDTPADSSNYKIGYNYVMQTCQEYFDFYRSDNITPILVEQVLGEIIYEDDEIRVMWKAKFDLTADNNQGIFPFDHKTMKQRRDSLSLNNQFIGQTILAKTRNIIINKIGFQTSLKPEEKFTRALISYSFDRQSEWIDMIAYYAKYWIALNENNYFPPRFSHCENKYGTCQFKSICEADRSMRNEELKLAFKIGRVWDIDND